MPDENALKNISAGNEAAFEFYFESYKGKLYNYLIRITKSREIAEEIVIDVFLKLWMGRDIIPEISNMDSFLRKVAYNKAMDFFKIAARNTRLQKLMAQEIENEKVKEADHRLMEKECQQILREAIKQLSPQRRFIFTLSRESGLTHEEIAEKLNLSRNTVRNTIAETLKSIRHFLRRNAIEGPMILCLLCHG